MRTPPTQSSPPTGIAKPPERNARSGQAGSFRESLKRRDEPRKAVPPGKTRSGHDPGVHARPDGMLVITAPMGPPGGPPDSRRSAGSPRPVARGPASTPARSVAITDVKVGGTKDSARVHARIGEGRHAGIELRAQEQNGKISIELVARDADAARALRGELADLRESLRARGLDAVNVEVRCDVRDGGGSHRDESREPDPDRTDDGGEDESSPSLSVQSPAQESDTIVL